MATLAYICLQNEQRPHYKNRGFRRRAKCDVGQGRDCRSRGCGFEPRQRRFVKLLPDLELSHLPSVGSAACF